LLQKVNPQHPLYPDGWPPLTRLGVMGLDSGTQLAPPHHLLHLLQKHSSSRFRDAARRGEQANLPAIRADSWVTNRCVTRDLLTDYLSEC